jgi:hypothetical protein
VAASAVTITGYTTNGRRLASARRLSGVDVQFEIEAPQTQADAIVSNVAVMESAALVTEIVAQVSTLGLEDELEEAAPGTTLSAVTAVVSEPVLVEVDLGQDNVYSASGVVYPDSASGVFSLLLGVLVTAGA